LGGGLGEPLGRTLEPVELDLNLGYISRATAKKRKTQGAAT